ncbi:uncharacterized protein LOC106065349 [Biomphalaria glabrata]|uniref:Uncharacterized protein LOC106065349 n=2 Tax=Biomphalaria glabrata TaxID=6526 RepID=A0A9W3AT27_BIOGL|nr:uncharacterized protein LOC106065349 [Biomphalaria glabrata]XP_055890373.1 uncharacterized protein LOC106065349 [Biomphalaria glabrata]KAI8777866.1 hypothetical protein BgiBS90_022069 [Biomphalaria glabrata]
MFLKLLSRLIAVAIIAGLSIAQVEHYWGSNKEYNAACPPGVLFVAVGFPAHLCNPRGFIMCSNGKAIAVSKCGIGETFNNVTGWCDPTTDFSLPAGCVNATAVKKYPVKCSDPGATYVAARNTCKKYVWCLQGGVNYTMDCPSMSLFIKEYERCMYVVEPYLIEIPPQSFAECQALDPIDFNKTRT